MSRRDISISEAEINNQVFRNTYQVVAREEAPNWAEKMVCKECGKEYHPGSFSSMSKHRLSHRD